MSVAYAGLHFGKGESDWPIGVVWNSQAAQVHLFFLRFPTTNRKQQQLSKTRKIRRKNGSFGMHLTYSTKTFPLF